jgi:hypothetical protein
LLRHDAMTAAAAAPSTGRPPASRAVASAPGARVAGLVAEIRVRVGEVSENGRHAQDALASSHASPLSKPSPQLGLHDVP